MDVDHPARVIDAFVNGLDRTSLQASYLGVGSLAHNPDLMLKIVLYETCQGHLSPARWARNVRDSDAVRWLGQGIQPSRSALYAFRDRLSQPVFEMHAQAIRQAKAEGLTAAEVAVLDGTSVRACASRHHLVNERGAWGAWGQTELEFSRGPWGQTADLGQSGNGVRPSF